MPNATAHLNHFEALMARHAASSSQVRSAAKELQVDYKNIDQTAADKLSEYFQNHPTAEFTAQNEETNMGINLTTGTITIDNKPPRKRTEKSQTSNVAKRAATGLSAAQVARDNELDARKFRAFLRANDMPRHFDNKTKANAAVKKFRKAQEAAA
jgi:hypothetical protein